VQGVYEPSNRDLQRGRFKVRETKLGVRLKIWLCGPFCSVFVCTRRLSFERKLYQQNAIHSLQSKPLYLTSQLFASNHQVYERPSHSISDTDTELCLLL
jgi:hypothetical protein